MKSQHISGGGGTRLHVLETGNPQGRPILFIHGFSQCCLAWTRQLDSDLAADYRLVAMDLRGHGLSDKPRDAYGESKLWADDVHAVISSLNLNGPVLSGWSYGGLVILDYIRHYGDEGLGGLQLVGAITKLGSDDALSVITPEFLKLVPGFFSAEVQESVKSLESLLRMCFVQAPSADELYPMLGYNVAVPPYVRHALFSRTLDNDDILPKVRKPVLISHGARDQIVKPSAVERHRVGLRHAKIHIMANSGHACFWEDPANFNQALRGFVAGL